MPVGEFPKGGRFYLTEHFSADFCVLFCDNCFLVFPGLCDLLYVASTCFYIFLLDCASHAMKGVRKDLKKV